MSQSEHDRINDEAAARLVEAFAERQARSPIPQATEPQHIGATANEPPPDRDMWQLERDNPWMVRLYAGVFLAVVLTCVAIGWWHS